MENSHSASYAAAGVDIEAGYRGVQLMKAHAARTVIPGVVSGIGGFGGLFAPNLTGMKEPVLVSGTDGVGTKLRLAQLLDKHDTIGIDCVAMCVNDIICCGAKPLFFLDYIAIGKNVPEKVADIVSGVAEGCVRSGCALIGGETAEHPGVMAPEDYDIAGFAVGVVDKSNIIDGSRIQEGDALIGLTSSGVHSNGFSLVRKVFDIENADLTTPMDELDGKPLGETLLAPTKIYVKAVQALLEGGVDLRGASHITGGGFFENLPRMLPGRADCAQRHSQAAHFRPDSKTGEHLGPRHVQHLQHGPRHGPGGTPGTGEAGPGAAGGGGGAGRRLRRQRDEGPPGRGV